MGKAYAPFWSSCPVSPHFRTSFVWEADTEKQSFISYQNVIGLIFLERGERVEQLEEFIGEIKARNGRLFGPYWGMGRKGPLPFHWPKPMTIP